MYLKDRRQNHPNSFQHSIVHLMAELGMTESEILHASFNSKRINRLTHMRGGEILASQILFEYRT